MVPLSQINKLWLKKILIPDFKWIVYIAPIWEYIDSGDSWKTLSYIADASWLFMWSTWFGLIGGMWLLLLRIISSAQLHFKQNLSDHY